VGEQPQKHEMLQQALRETALSPFKMRQWYSSFINGRTSSDDDHTQADLQKCEPMALTNMSTN